MPRPGREFEKAVYAFARTLDPSAEVLFDHKVPDRDTGKPRQCDVWINARFGGHWPQSILVSCKDYRRKIHSGNIGTFCDEVRSTGASTGVIYNKSGFTKPALRKAKANGLACCRLYENEPPDIPATIWIEFFACAPKICLRLESGIGIPEIKTWNDLFDIRLKDGITALEVVSAAFHNGEDQVVNEAKQTGMFPKGWVIDIAFEGIEGFEATVRMKIFGDWKLYRAKMEAILLDGSYCLSNDSFRGTLTGPWVDIRGEDPGEHWMEITEQDFTLPPNWAITILCRGDVEQALREKVGPYPLPDWPY